MFNILVVFNDGTKKVFNDVAQYGFNIESGKYFVNKNFDEKELRSFLLPKNVKYFGPVEYWEEKSESEIICCKDCVYYNEDPFKFTKPCCTRFGFTMHNMVVNPEDFCSKAVRRK